MIFIVLHTHIVRCNSHLAIIHSMSYVRREKGKRATDRIK